MKVRKLKVVLVTGTNFEVAVPEEFNFIAWWTSIQAVHGWVLNSVIGVPLHAIAFAQLIEEEIKETDLTPPQGVDFSGGLTKQ